MTASSPSHASDASDSAWDEFRDGGRPPPLYARPVYPSAQRQKTAAASVVSSALDIDSAFAFALFASMLFSLQLGTVGAVLFVILTLAYTALKLIRLPEIIRPRAFLLLIPALMVFSTVWSDSPLDSLKYSMEFSLTVWVALLLSAAPRPTGVLFGVFCAFSIYIVVSLIFGQSVAVGTTGQTAFSGLTSGKNTVADSSSTCLLITSAVFLASLSERRFLRALVAVPVAAVMIYVLAVARSAGASLGLVLGLGAYFFLLTLRSVVLPVRATVTAFLGLFVVAGGVFYRDLSSALIDSGARFFDKDPTLTGRTYLWQRAADLIAEKPVFGKGFNAFWLQGNTDAEGLWRYAHVVRREGFNFHNTFIDLLVQVGWFGLTVICVTIIVALTLLIARFIKKPNMILCLWLGMLVYQMVRMPIEYIGFTEFFTSTVLMYAALAAGFPAQQPATTPTLSSQSKAYARTAKAVAR